MWRASEDVSRLSYGTDVVHQHPEGAFDPRPPREFWTTDGRLRGTHCEKRPGRPVTVRVVRVCVCVCVRFRAPIIARPAAKQSYDAAF